MYLDKDFDNWNELKKEINNINKETIFYEREVWFCNFGLNVGHEQNGKNKDYLRPAIIVKKFNKRLLWIIPLTKQNKNGIYYFNLKIKGIENSAILSQLRVFDVNRLQYKIDYVGKEDFEDIIKKLLELFPRVF